MLCTCLGEKHENEMRFAVSLDCERMRKGQNYAKIYFKHRKTRKTLKKAYASHLPWRKTRK